MNNASQKVRRAPGFEDRAGTQFQRMQTAIDTLRKQFATRGYIPIDTPLIEHTELFLRMSGGLLSSQLFDFTGPDGSNISVRPELTAPVIRYALENDDAPLPQRYQYAAPVVRYTERPYDAPTSSVPNPRQVIQVGAELIGEAHPASDAEVIAMAYEAAKRITNQTALTVRVGHVGLIWSILEQFTISERAKLFLANSVEKLTSDEASRRSVQHEADRLGLTSIENASRSENVAEAEFISRIVSGAASLPYQNLQSSRSAEEIIERLRQNLNQPHDAGDFARAMKCISEIATVRGDADLVSDQLHVATQRYNVNPSDALQNLVDVVDAAKYEDMPSTHIQTDIGMATGIAYYTGMIFDISISEPNRDDNVRLGGGGRYDRLASALGSADDLPALGFALDLDAMLALSQTQQHDATGINRVLVVPADKESVGATAALARSMRNKGVTAIALFAPTQSFQQIASANNAGKVIRVSSDGSMETLQL